MTTEEKIKQILLEYKFGNLGEKWAIEDMCSVLREANIKMLEELDLIGYDQQYIFIGKMLSELREEGKEKGKV